MRIERLLCQILILLTLATVSFSAKLPGYFKPGYQQLSVPLPAVNRVAVKGDIDVVLKTGYSHPKIILRGINQNDNLLLNIDQAKGLLVVKTKGHIPKGASIEIQTHYLNYFGFRGHGNIIAKRLKSSLLNLHIDNSGQTIINGSVNLQQLEARGSGLITINGVRAQNLSITMIGNPKIKLSGIINAPTLNITGKGSLELFWIKSDNLRVRMKNAAYVQLAGIVNRLDVELWDNAHFNGRYLRAKRTFAKTHDRSIAEITTLDRQHAMASDASDIYFYKIPTMKAGFMAYNGAILDMRDPNNLMSYDYNRYNK